MSFSYTQKNVLELFKTKIETHNLFDTVDPRALNKSGSVQLAFPREKRPARISQPLASIHKAR